MWCRHCHQQTPSMGPPTEMGPRCARCGRTTPAESYTPGASTPDAPLEGSEESGRAIYRSLRAAQATLAAGEAARTLRYDLDQSPLVEALRGPHEGAERPRRTVARPQPLPAPPSPAASSRGQALPWILTSLGAAAVGVGVGLGAWSLVGERPELWSTSIAATLGGQCLLILGLVQLLAAFWTAASKAANKLAQVHDEVRRLRRTAEESAGRHHASAAGFYADLARDAPPDRLLGNLRGQLDRLAARLR